VVMKWIGRARVRERWSGRLGGSEGSSLTLKKGENIYLGQEVVLEIFPLSHHNRAFQTRKVFDLKEDQRFRQRQQEKSLFRFELSAQKYLDIQNVLDRLLCMGLTRSWNYSPMFSADK
jgi:hypothetical protein